MSKIQIIVGSVTGTAEGVAAHLQKHWQDTHQVRVFHDATTAHLVEDPDELLLFITSNTGAGDLPDNIAPLYVGLRNEFPRIAGRKFGLINLGDSSYPTFGEAGKNLYDALVDIGAISAVEPLLVDASEERYPQKMALEWAEDWLAACRG